MDEWLHTHYGHERSLKHGMVTCMGEVYSKTLSESLHWEFSFLGLPHASKNVVVDTFTDTRDSSAFVIWYYHRLFHFSEFDVSCAVLPST